MVFTCETSISQRLSLRDTRMVSAALPDRIADYDADQEDVMQSIAGHKEN